MYAAAAHCERCVALRYVVDARNTPAVWLICPFDGDDASGSATSYEFNARALDVTKSFKPSFESSIRFTTVASGTFNAWTMSIVAVSTTVITPRLFATNTCRADLL